MATEAMNESWRRVKAQIESIWDETEFNAKEMKRARGNMRKMVNLIEDQTGEPREEIVRKMGAIL